MHGRNNSMLFITGKSATETKKRNREGVSHDVIKKRQYAEYCRDCKELGVTPLDVMQFFNNNGAQSNPMEAKPRYTDLESLDI